MKRNTRGRNLQVNLVASQSNNITVKAPPPPHFLPGKLALLETLSNQNRDSLGEFSVKREVWNFIKNV